jgi:hypothetical protein
MKNIKNLQNLIPSWEKFPEIVTASFSSTMQLREVQRSLNVS